MKSPITTHVLDTAKGCPAEGISVSLERRKQNEWFKVGQGKTNADGRVTDLMPAGSLEKGDYRISFDVDAYHRGTGFFPIVTIDFRVINPLQHHHVPLLLSPFGFSTYRGS